MRKQIINLYTFDELPEEVQQKVIEDNNDINVNYDWYDYLYDSFKDELKKIGVECEKFYFDLSNYIFMERPYVVNTKKFMTFCGFKDLRKKDAKQYLDGNYDLEIKTNKDKNYVTYGYIGYEAYELTEALNGKLEEFLSQLREAYDYLTSEEAIKETIISNEYEFTINGDFA